MDAIQDVAARDRVSYPAWRRVFNVGFRVLCEDTPSLQAER